MNDPFNPLGANSRTSSILSPPLGTSSQRPSLAAQHGRSLSGLSVGSGAFSGGDALQLAGLPDLRPTSDSIVAQVEQATFDPQLDTTGMLDDGWNDQDFNADWFNIDPGEYYSNGLNSCGFIPNVPKIIDEVDRGDLMQSTEGAAAPTPMSFSDTNIHAPESQMNTSAIITDEREHEMAYLVRHFTEAIGPW